MIADIRALVGGAPAEIVWDSRIHKFKVDGGKRASLWYVARFYRGKPYVTFGSWIDGSKYTISLNGVIDSGVGFKPTKSDNTEWKQKSAIQFAREIWNHSVLKGCHPYLDKKKILPIRVKTFDLSRIPEQKSNWFASWIGQYDLDGATLVPMLIDGEINNLQFITPDVKCFLPNAPQKGAYLPLGNPTDSDRLIIATGYATSNTLHECMGLPVYCVFSDSNIATTIPLIQRRHPKHSLIIAADNDIHADPDKLNSGVFYSTAAAKKYDLLLAVPELNGTKIDYNDLFVALGKQAVIDSVNAAAKVDASTNDIPASKPSEELKSHYKDWLNKGGHLAVNAPAGLGKSTVLLQEIQHQQLRCDYFVPSHKLAQEQVDRMPPGKAIAIRGRSHKTEDGECLCAKWESAAILTRIGMAHKTMPLLCGRIDYRTGRRPCPHSYTCGYLRQFNDTAPIRFYAHEYLPLDNGKLTKRDIDVIVIDETFHDSLEKSQSWSVGKLMTQEEPIYRDLAMAVMDNSLLSKADRISEIDEILNAEEEIECHIHPEMESGLVAQKLRKQTEGKRPPTSFLWNCKKAIEAGAFNRLFVGGDKDDPVIISSYAKPTQFITKQTPTAYIDASLVDPLMKTLNSDCKIIKIEASRKAHIVQITDSAMSKRRLTEDNDYLSSRLIHFMQTRADINPNGAVIAPKDWIDKHKERFPASVKRAHFGGLRGLNTLEHCDWLMVIGRNQPPQSAVEAIARAWWPSEPLTLTGNYVRESRLLEDKTGLGAQVMVQTHADPRCRAILEAMREQESVQAVDRLRLIHTDRLKQVWLFCNLPLPGIVPDELATVDSLCKPGRMAEMALRDRVIVTDRKVMTERYPDVFSSEKAAKEYLAECDLNAVISYRESTHLTADGEPEPEPYNGSISYRDIYRRSGHCRAEAVTYRLPDQRGGKPRTVIVPTEMEPAEVRARLEAIHGKPVKLADAFTQQHDADVDLWDVLGRVDADLEPAVDAADPEASPPAGPDARFVVWSVKFADGHTATIRDPEGMDHAEALRYALAQLTGAVSVSAM